jgi:hypothetical protein
MSDLSTAEVEVWLDDEMVSSVSGPREEALKEAERYAIQYCQDGAVTVYEITRKLVYAVHGNMAARVA